MSKVLKNTFTTVLNLKNGLGDKHYLEGLLADFGFLDLHFGTFAFTCDVLPCENFLSKISFSKFGHCRFFSSNYTFEEESLCEWQIRK